MPMLTFVKIQVSDIITNEVLKHPAKKSRQKWRNLDWTRSPIDPTYAFMQGMVANFILIKLFVLKRGHIPNKKPDWKIGLFYFNSTSAIDIVDVLLKSNYMIKKLPC